MKDANISAVLIRFQEIFEVEIRKAIVKYKQLSEEQVNNAFERSRKQAMRELCITGCPYAQIWECKQ